MEILDIFGKIADSGDNLFPRKYYTSIFDRKKYLIIGDGGSGKTVLSNVLANKDRARELGRYCGANMDEIEATDYINGLAVFSTSEGTEQIPSVAQFMEIGSRSEGEIRVFWKRLILVALKGERISDWDAFWEANATIKGHILHGEIIALANQYRSEGRYKILVYDHLEKLPTDDKRRGKLISALLEIWEELNRFVSHLSCKLFVREDIFNDEVRITDKVKLVTFTVKLKWDYDQSLNLVWQRLWQASENGKLLPAVFRDWYRCIESEDHPGFGLIPNANEAQNRAMLDMLVGTNMGKNINNDLYNWILCQLSGYKNPIKWWTYVQIPPQRLLVFFQRASEEQKKLEAKGKKATAVFSPYALRLAKKSPL